MGQNIYFECNFHILTRLARKPIHERPIRSLDRDSVFHEPPIAPVGGHPPLEKHQGRILVTDADVGIRTELGQKEDALLDAVSLTLFSRVRHLLINQCLLGLRVERLD